ncbi:MAG: acetate--CoA ligase [Candidatus Undinarchaeales archaeon]|jgi:acetyl-CoA synthetase|nr:acetate--CoA ligase [Candidatus Undinarchaeales archaeon]
MTKEKTIDSMLQETRTFKPSPEFSKKSYVKSLEEYKKIYDKSIEDPEKFWAEKAENLHWFKKWDKIHSWDVKKLECKWFEGGKLNATYNCLDRHLEERGDKTAIIWEADDGKTRTFTYKELHEQVCKFANVLKEKGIKKGDRVAFYLQMIPQLAIAMLACARIGAIHSIVFGGFSAEALRDRIHDSECVMLITSDGGFRGGKLLDQKKNADTALEDAPSIKNVIVVKRAENEVTMKEDRDLWWHDVMKNASADCPAEEMDAEDPLFILYTSGTTGKPKGVLHTTGGYMLYTYQTFKWIFDYHEEDIFWCTADIGWITGHSYIIYGPLANGATTVMFEGIPTYPEPDRFWDIVEKHKVNIFYTAPTAVRALAKQGDEWVDKHEMPTLRLLGSVGEPINPDAWVWYHEHVGKKRCPIVDTWWQTETGGVLITPLPGAMPLKPGSACLPFPGIEAEVVRKDGSRADPNEGGFLVIKKPWPSMLRTVYGDHDRFRKTYFSDYPEMYYTSDAARVDNDGYFWLMGRVDDVVNISGHRIGTAEVESALVSHPAVAESAIVPFPHEIKGQALYAFVLLKKGNEGSDALVKELRNHVSKEIGPIAKPDKIQFADALPKTRSGKIMRRILKKIAAGEEDVGTTTTLANPEVVEKLKEEKV